MDKRIFSGLGADIDESLVLLDSLLRAGSLEFISGLWDKALGGFYYSESARDYKGFSPDADSTVQVLKLISSGAFCGVKGCLGEKLPDDVKEILINFADRASSRGAEIKELLGASKDNSKKNDKEMQSTAFDSGAALVSHLDVLFSDGSAATKLKLELPSIKKARLTDTLFGYLDERIEKNLSDGRIFSERCGYDALAELHRIGALYIGEERKISHAGELVKLAVETMLSDSEPENILGIYNLWAALRTVLQSIGECDERERAELYSYVRANAKALVAITVKRLGEFKKCDGGYSYYKDKAPASPRGTRIALGILEGEINSTVTALHGIRGNVFFCLGLTTPPLFDEVEFLHFISAMQEEKTIKKRRIPLKMKIKLYKK